MEGNTIQGRKRFFRFFTLIACLIFSVNAFSADGGILSFTADDPIERFLEKGIPKESHGAELKSLIIYRLSHGTDINLSKQALVNSAMAKSDQDALSHGRLLNIDYLLSGSYKTFRDQGILQIKLYDIAKNRVQTVNTGIEPKIDIYLLIEKAIDQILSKMKGTSNLGKITREEENLFPSTNIDLFFAYSSNLSMKEELNTLRRHIYSTFENIYSLNPANVVNIGYININDNQVFQPITHDINLLVNRLDNIKWVNFKQEGMVNLAFTLEKIIGEGKFTMSNNALKVVFIISDEALTLSDKDFETISERYRKLNIKIIPLVASGMPDQSKQWLNEFSELTFGKTIPVTYYYSVKFDQYNMIDFLFRDHSVYRFDLNSFNRNWIDLSLKHPEQVIDLTLGRKVASIDEVNKFLTQEGYIIDHNTSYKNDNDIDYQIFLSLKDYFNRSDRRPAGELKVQSGNYIFYISVGNGTAASQLNNIPIGSEILVGGQIVPSSTKERFIFQTNFDLNPNTIIILNANAAIPKSLIRTVDNIKHDPYWHHYHGMFEEKIWFMMVKVLEVTKP